MFNGLIKQIIQVGESYWVEVTEPSTKETTGLYCDYTTESRHMRPDDSVWWRGQTLYWTSQKFNVHEKNHHYARDIKIPLLGQPGQPHPGKRIIDLAYPTGCPQGPL